jgi:hypothetical protein
MMNELTTKHTTTNPKRLNIYEPKANMVWKRHIMNIFF